MNTQQSAHSQLQRDLETAELYCNLIKLDFHTLGNRIELEKTELEKIELGKTRKAMQNCIPILR